MATGVPSFGSRRPAAVLSCAQIAVRRAWLLLLFLVPMLVASSVAPSIASAAPREHLRVRVYVLDFDPIMDDGVALSIERGWNDASDLDDQYRVDVASASGRVVEQRIVHTSVVRAFPVKPGGFAFTNAQYVGCLASAAPAYCSALIDYPAVLNTRYDEHFGSACEALKKKRVDEVWLWGGPWFGYLEYRIAESNTLCPLVTRPFVVMGFSYERSVAEMLHNLGHRAEALVQGGIGLTLWDRFDGQRDRYAEDYACPAQPDAGHPEVTATGTHAGNVHFPPNAYCHYQYDRDHPVLSDADDWANFPDLTGRQVVVSASTWGATQRGFLLWWLGRFPRNPGVASGVRTDWWRYVFPSVQREVHCLKRASANACPVTLIVDKLGFREVGRVPPDSVHGHSLQPYASSDPARWADPHASRRAQYSSEVQRQPCCSACTGRSTGDRPRSNDVR